jgi:hypothetical protein
MDSHPLEKGALANPNPSSCPFWVLALLQAPTDQLADRPKLEVRLRHSLQLRSFASPTPRAPPQPSSTASVTAGMADPISIVGTAGAVLGIIDVLAKTIRSLQDLRAQWKIIDTVVVTFELQLTSLNTALTQIKKWADANSDDPHYQLVIDLGRCLSHCEFLVSIISAEVDTLKATEGDQSVGSKITLLFRTQEMAEVQKMIDHVTNALVLLLKACNRCRHHPVCLQRNY